MRVFITGGAGCLGTNLIEHLLPMGHEIKIFDNFATGKREAVDGIPGLEIVEGTIADKAALDHAISAFKPDIIIHSAAAYKDPDDWIEDAATNVIGSCHVAQAAKEFDVKRVINFQTALCYGRPPSVPIPVDLRPSPFTSYGISKTAGEQYMMLSGVPTLSLRTANVTGPRLAIGPIPTFYKRLKEGKSCFCTDSVRDFLDMSDFLDFITIAMELDAPAGVYNLSTGEPHSIKDVFDQVCEYLELGDVEVPIVPPNEDDVPAVYLDPSKTEKDFGWKSTVSFKDTINKQLAWYDAHGITDVYSHLKASGD